MIAATPDTGEPPGPSTSSSMPLDDSDNDGILSQSTALTREEVICRRLRRLKKLSKLYREYYWVLMEELRVRHREYYWLYGMSPYKEDKLVQDGDGKLLDDQNKDNFPSNGKAFGVVNVEAMSHCVISGCKSKAMALTRFCHPHILSDPKQVLYKGCAYVIKSAPSGVVLCGKPILGSTIPSLCSFHFQKAEKHAIRALKKAGLNISSSSSTYVPPKLHDVVTQFVREIQTRRRTARKSKEDN